MINISNRLITLRKERHLTQTDVAEHLGVTKASVSKWETGQTLPDIALLPLIASYYDVTLDELMGYEPTLTPQQIQAKYEQYTEVLAGKTLLEVFPEIKDEVRRYYSCYPFLYAMALLLLNHCPPAGAGGMSPELVSEIRSFMESLCQRVEANAADKLLRENATSIRMYLTMQAGQFEEVIEELSDLMLPDQIGGMEGILITAYTASGKLQEADEAAQIAIYRNVLELLQYTLHRMQLQAGDPVALEEHTKRGEALMEAYDIIHLHPNTAASFYYQSALLWLGANPDRALHYLNLYAEAARNLFRDNLQIHGDEYFPCITAWFAGNRMGAVPVRNQKEVLQSVLEGFDYPALQALGQDKLTHMKETLRSDCENEPKRNVPSDSK